jgi:hypothetical protein
LQELKLVPKRYRSWWTDFESVKAVVEEKNKSVFWQLKTEQQSQNHGMLRCSVAINYEDGRRNTDSLTNLRFDVRKKLIKSRVSIGPYLGPYLFIHPIT